MTTNGQRLLAAPIRGGGTPAERWLKWDREFPELAIDECPALVLVSAHADDETLGLGATAAMLGKKVQVVCATDTPEMDRRGELEEACQILGVKKPIFLALPDGQLVWHARDLADRLLAMLDEGEPRGVAAFELGNRLFERLHRGCAEPPIGELLFVGFERRRGGKQDGGAAIDRRIDETVETLRVTPGVRQPRIRFLTW